MQKYQQKGRSENLGYPFSDYSSYSANPLPERTEDRKKFHPLEGAGRQGWDYDQNRSYGNVFGNNAGPSTYVNRGEVTHYRGKGPRNYRRADERILDDVHKRLEDDWEVDASDIEVTVKDGEVVLSGFVNERFEKRRAEDVVESISGVKQVENRIKKKARFNRAFLDLDVTITSRAC
jgi:hypothetical protein